MTTTRTRTDAGLATALRISVSRLARRLRAQRAVSGMTEAVLSETQLAALSALEVHHAMTPGELAEHEKVQPPSMTRVIAVLEERDLVLRSPHPTDRRQVVLTVTEEGRAVVQRVRRRKDAWRWEPFITSPSALPTMRNSANGCARSEGWATTSRP